MHITYIFYLGEAKIEFALTRVQLICTGSSGQLSICSGLNLFLRFKSDAKQVLSTHLLIQCFRYFECFCVQRFFTLIINGFLWAIRTDPSRILRIFCFVIKLRIDHENLISCHTKWARLLRSSRTNRFSPSMLSFYHVTRCRDLHRVANSLTLVDGANFHLVRWIGIIFLTFLLGCNNHALCHLL